MTRYRQQVTETAGIYNTAGFNDDTRAFCSIPARHDLSRRVDANFLGGLVARHVIELDDARVMARALAYELARETYRLAPASRASRRRDVPSRSADVGRDDARHRARDRARLGRRSSGPRGRSRSPSSDNVAVALRPIAAGERVNVDG